MQEKMLLASVIVDVSSRAIQHPFSYKVPTALEQKVKIGCAVSVQFGYRAAIGYVVKLYEQTDSQGQADGQEQISQKKFKLKSLLGVLSEPYFDEISAQLIFWIADEYLCPLPDALHLFTAPGSTPKIKRINETWQLVHPGVGAVDDRWVSCTQKALNFKPAKNATKQIAVLQALSEGGMRVAELAAELGTVNSTLNTLEKKGVLLIEKRRRFRGTASALKQENQQLRMLTEGQQNALNTITDAFNNVLPSISERVVVMDGITGSGKTEVYLRAIAHCLEQKKTAIVLVPEITLTPQTVGRFRARFGDNVAVLHSRLSLGERFDQWDLARQQKVQVVVGTRSALFAPLSNIGLIIIDEEHDSSYKQDSGARYSARDVAVQMCKLRGATLVLGSATPDIVTLAHCKNGWYEQSAQDVQAQGEHGKCAQEQGEKNIQKQCAQNAQAQNLQNKNMWRRVCLPQRPNKKPLPSVKIIDLAQQFKSGSASMFSVELVEALQQVYANNEKAVLLFNRRGFASFLLCRACGFTPQCPNCSVNLTYHEVSHILMCHHCGYKENVPPRCPQCKSPYLRKLGAGTQKVEAELKNIVPPDMRIIRMDADTTKKKGAHEALLEQFGVPGSAILLGTQMIAKGLDFPDVTLVGVLNADTALKLPDFRAAERTYQLIEQVAGRAGRADKPGKVIVQTYTPKHPAIVAAAAHKREIFLKNELPSRKELSYPPYARLANIIFWSDNENLVRQEATKFYLALNSACESAGVNWQLLGPAPCLLSRVKKKFRWHILIKAPIFSQVKEEIQPQFQLQKVTQLQAKNQENVQSQLQEQEEFQAYGSVLNQGQQQCIQEEALSQPHFSPVLSPVLAKHRKDKRVRMAIDVDPLNLF